MDALKLGVSSISGGVNSLSSRVKPVAQRTLAGAGRSLRSLGLLRGVAMAALVVTAGWIVAGLVWQVAFPPVRSAPAPVIAAAPERPTPESLANRGIIIEPELTFFGTPEVAEAALPASTAPFQLAGIMLSSDQAASRVIVRVDSIDRIFGVGDALPNGAIIDMIGADSVIIRTANGRETLSLPKQDFAAAPVADPAAANPLLNVVPLQPNGQPIEAPTNINRSVFQDREAMFGMVAGIKTSLVGSEAGASGLRLDNLGTVQVLRQVGLRDGDIVTEVNGLPIQRQDSFAKILESVQNGSTIRVVVYRNGQLVTKSINILENN